MSVSGQTYVSTGSDTCIATISRNPAGNSIAHYMKTGPYSGKILVSPVAQSGGISFRAIPVTNYNISDITILGDTVFFCGDDTAGIGFYGWCKKQSGMYPMNPPYDFNIYRLYSGDSIRVTDVSRIRVFRSGSDLNVLLVAKCYEKGIIKSSIVHIKNNLTCKAAYGGEHFDDVEILDDYVVAVGRKSGNDNQYQTHHMRVLNKNAFSLNDFLFMYYYCWDVRPALGRMLVQKIRGNGAVSVYRGTDGFYFNTLTVNGGILQLHRYYMAHTPEYFIGVSDVEYNNVDSTLLIVHNEDTIGIASKYDCSSFPTATYVSSYKADFRYMGYRDTLLSVAKMSSSGFYVTGIKNKKMALWEMPNGCEGYVFYNNYTAESQINRSRSFIRTTPVGVHCNSFVVIPNEEGFVKKCYTLSPDSDSQDKDNE